MQPGLLALMSVVRLVGAPSEPPAWAAPVPAIDDTDDDHVVGPPDALHDCHERMEQAGASFSPSRIRVHRNRSDTLTCGAPQVVRYEGGPTGIRWKGKPKLTCAMALGLARFELIVQQEAQRHLGRAVTRIAHMGTYNCREMAAYPGWVSEHSYANAIDIRHFVLQGGRVVSVLEDWGAAAEDAGKDNEARFLRAVARRAYDEDVFSVVLTPAFDRAHRNHFHLDLARYRVDGTRP